MSLDHGQGLNHADVVRNMVTESAKQHQKFDVAAASEPMLRYILLLSTYIDRYAPLAQWSMLMISASGVTMSAELDTRDILSIFILLVFFLET